MTEPSKTRRTQLVSALALVAAATMFGALPAQAAPGSPPTLPPAAEKVAYAALGDSYAAGFGGGDYTDPPCFQSPNGYAALLASDPGNVHVALRGCTGAGTADVIDQLGGLDHRTKFVTLTVGANDLGLATVTAACLDPVPVNCASAVAAALGNVPAMTASLNESLEAIRSAAPRATVAVTGYPLFFDVPADDPTKQAVNLGIGALNTAIAGTVASAGAGFTFVDVVDDFAGHGLDSGDPWIVSPIPPALDAFHPDADGHAAYADAIRAVR